MTRGDLTPQLSENAASCSISLTPREVVRNMLAFVSPFSTTRMDRKPARTRVSACFFTQLLVPPFRRRVSLEVLCSVWRQASKIWQRSSSTPLRCLTLSGVRGGLAIRREHRTTSSLSLKDSFNFTHAISRSERQRPAPTHLRRKRCPPVALLFSGNLSLNEPLFFAIRCILVAPAIP